MSNESCNLVPFGANVTDNSLKNPFATLTLELPTFWLKNPSVWFIQNEAQFSIFNVTSEEVKYCLTLASLPFDICKIIADQLTNLPATDKYEFLKKSIIQAVLDTEEERLKAQLTDDDHSVKPSDLYAMIKRLNADKFFKNVVKKVWLSKLSLEIRTSLLAVSRDMKIAQLIQLADNLYSVANYQVQKQNALEKRLSNLEWSLSKLNIKSCRSVRKRRRCRQKRKKRMCWYHYTFGRHAYKCDDYFCVYRRSMFDNIEDG